MTFQGLSTCYYTYMAKKTWHPPKIGVEPLMRRKEVLEQLQVESLAKMGRLKKLIAHELKKNGTLDE